MDLQAIVRSQEAITCGGSVDVQKFLWLRNGLKENEVQRRYAKAYESNYMTEQLAKLVMTVSTQVQKLRSRTTKNPSRTPSDDSDDGAPESCQPFCTGFLGFFQRRPICRTEWSAMLTDTLQMGRRRSFESLEALDS